MLEEDGLLAISGDGWEVRDMPDDTNPAVWHRQLMAAFPDCAIELRLLGRCGDSLAEVLRGTRDSLPVLFSPDGLADPERLYRSSPVSATFQSSGARRLCRGCAAATGRS